MVFIVTLGWSAREVGRCGVASSGLALPQGAAATPGCGVISAAADLHSPPSPLPFCPTAQSWLFVRLALRDLVMLS